MNRTDDLLELLAWLIERRRWSDALATAYALRVEIQQAQQAQQAQQEGANENE